MELLPKAGGVIGNFLAINLAGLAEDLEITLSLDWGLFRLDIWVGGVRVWEGAGGGGVVVRRRGQGRGVI